MVCRSTPGNSAITSIARGNSGLHDVQVLSLFHEVRASVPRDRPAPDPAEIARFMSGAAMRASHMSMTARQRTDLSNRIQAAIDTRPDGRTFYAWQNIEERAISARAAMETHFAAIATEHQVSTTVVENAFNALVHRDHAIDGEQPQAPEHVHFSLTNLPGDRRTRYALAMLYEGGSLAASSPAASATAYAAIQATSTRLGANPEANPANRCPECGEFAAADHVCAHVADLGASHIVFATNPPPTDSYETFTPFRDYDAPDALSPAEQAEAVNTAALHDEMDNGNASSNAHVSQLDFNSPIVPASTDALDEWERELLEQHAQAAAAEDSNVIWTQMSSSVVDSPAPVVPRRQPARPAATRNPVRTYRVEDDADTTVQMMNVSAVRSLGTGETQTLEDIRVQMTDPLVVDEFGGGSRMGRIVTGSLMVTNTGQRRSRNRDRFAVAGIPTTPDPDSSEAADPTPRSLRCNCPDYRRNYDCGHLRQATEHVAALLNQRDAVAVAPAAAMDTVGAALRTEYDNSLAASETARADFAATGDDVSYAENMSAFQSDWDEAKARFESGDHTLPYMTENVTNGLGARVGGRSVGIEIEVDFPSDTTYEAKHRVAREIYEAGLSDSPEVRPWHWRARQTGHRGQPMGGGYTDDPNMWSVEFDRSVDDVGGNRGCEIVSPIMYDEPHTWTNITKICEIVERHGGKVTPRTGLHVNVGAGDFDHTVGNHNRLVGLANAYEDVIVRAAHNPASGANHRGREFCRPMTMPSEGFTSIREAQRSVDPTNYDGSSHRAMINLDHVPAEGSPVVNSTRVEVRIFDGSLDPGRIQADIKMSLGLVNAAVRGVEVPRDAERAGTRRTQNVGANGRMRRLRGEQWENDTASCRRLVDTLFSRAEDKKQFVYAFAASRWQRA